MRTSAPPRRIGVTVAALAVAALLTACGGDEPTVPSDENPAFKATGTPSVAVSPLAQAPRDFRTVQGEGFTISAASAFQEERTTSSNGQPALALRRPSSSPELPSGVVVLRDVDPKQDVVEQTYALEVSKRTLGAKDVVRSDVTWPGARRAVVVEWTEEVPVTGGRTVAAHYVQLSAQVNDKLILGVVALAPVTDTQTSQVLDVLRTFRPTA